MKEKIKGEMRKSLDEELNKILKENETMHITAARKLAIEKLGLTINNTPFENEYVRKNCLIWGSCAGYDKQYFVNL